jgi:hypothetical protein
MNSEDTDFEAALTSATAEPDPGFVARLRADVVGRLSASSEHAHRHIEPVSDQQPELVLVEPLSSSRRRRVPLLAGICAAVLVATVAIAVIHRSGTPHSSVRESEPTVPVDTSTSSLSTAPATPTGEPATSPWIWLSRAEVSTSGGALLAVVVNSSDTPLDVSPANGPGTFERWTGSRWERVGTWANGTADYHGTVAFPWPLIMLPSGETGSAESVTIPPQRAGRYRLTKFGASGTFEISDNPTIDPYLGTVEPKDLTIGPQLLGADGGPVHLTKAAQSIGEMETFVNDVSPIAAIERWADGAWSPVGQTPLIADGLYNAAGMAAVLPPQPNGTYRLVLTGPAGVVHGIFWVSDAVEARPAITPTAQFRANRLPVGWVSLGSEPRWRAGRALSAGPRGSATVTLITDDQLDDSLRGSTVVATAVVAGRPASFVVWNGGSPQAALLMQDGPRRLLAERLGKVSDAELIAIVEALEPFPLTDAASAPIVPDRYRGSVAELLGKVEGAATVTGWVVIDPNGKIKLCESVTETAVSPCGAPSIDVEPYPDPPFNEAWKVPPMRRVGGYQVSETRVEVAGSLKGDILFPGVL